MQQRQRDAMTVEKYRRTMGQEKGKADLLVMKVRHHAHLSLDRSDLLGAARLAVEPEHDGWWYRACL